MNMTLDNDLENLLVDSDLNSATVDRESTIAPPATSPQQDLSFFGKIPVNVTLEVASTEITLQELMEVDASSVIVLDKLAGAPLDVKVNGALFANAEVVLVSGNYGLRIVELNDSNLSELTR